MTNQCRSDTAGILQLAGMAAFGAAFWAPWYLAWPQLGILPAVLLVIAGAIAGVLAQFWEWERLGGRAVVVMTNSWIRNGAVPSTVSPEESVPLLRMRDRSASRQWWQLFFPGFWIPYSVVHLVTDRQPSDQLLWVAFIVLFSGLAAWTVYYNLRRLPVIRRLLRTAYFAETPAVPENHQDSNA